MLFKCFKTSFKILFVVVLAIALRSESKDIKTYICPTKGFEKWVTIDNKTCYFLYDNKTEPHTTWHLAYDKCNEIGGQLPAIHSIPQNQMLIDITQAHNWTTRESSYGYWIGLNSLERRGQYKWTDGSPAQFSNYAIGNLPIGVKKTEASDISIRGRCVYMLDSLSTNQTYGYWYYANCVSELASVVCEKNFTQQTVKSTTTPTPPGNCASDWLEFADNKCIKILNKTDMTWTQAKTNCLAIGGEMLSIHSFEEQNFITSLLPNQTTPFIGFKGVGSSYQTKWTWDDQTRVSYTNWDAQGWTQSGCAVIMTDELQAGRWSRVDCSTKHSAICAKQKDISITTAHKNIFVNCSIDGFKSYNFVEFRNSCYLIVDNSAEQRDWDSAESVCEQMNGSHLVSIVNPYEYSFVIYYLQQFAKSKQFWIGFYTDELTDNTTTHVYQWTDQWPNYFTKWADKQPDTTTQKDKVCVYQSRSTGLWSTDECATKKSFICKTTRNPMPTTDQKFNGFCPKSAIGWRDIDKRSKYCYYFSSDTSKDGTYDLPWTTAAHECRQRNGTLASIHSSHELLLFKNNIIDVKDETWIGLHVSYFGKYIWEDNSAVDYTNWNGKRDHTDDDYERPHHKKPNDRCVSIVASDMTWIERECSSSSGKKHYICQTPKVSKISTIPTTTSSPPINSTKAVSEKGLTSGDKAGIALGVIGLVSLIASVGFFMFRKYRPNQQSVPSFQNSLYTSGRGKRTAESPSAEPVVVWSKINLNDNKPESEDKKSEERVPDVPKRKKKTEK